MARLSKKEARFRMVLTVMIAVAIGLLLILGIRALLLYAPDAMRAVLAWLIHLFPPVALAPSQSLSAATSVAPVAPSSPPSPPAQPTAQQSTPQGITSLSLSALSESSTLSIATFTEIFLNAAYEDASRTTVYEDRPVNAISLVPDVTVSPTTAAFSPPPVTPTGVPASEDLDGTVTSAAGKDGAVYTARIPAFPDLVVTSSFPGILRFGYDPSTQRTLVVYAAYESRVFEMGPTGKGTDGLIADYSDFFGPSVFSGGGFGGRGVDPVIFPQDGLWWIFSGPGSTNPKLMKLGNGIVVDYTKMLFSAEATLTAAPGPAPHEIYVKGSSGSYLLADNGFKQQEAQWVSSKLNQWDGNVKEGEITSVGDSAAFSGEPAGIPAPRYFLSNDGGITWIAATPGAPVTFPTAGGDFRFKAVLSPGSSGSGFGGGDPYTTPWVNAVRLSYGVKQSAF